MLLPVDTFQYELTDAKFLFYVTGPRHFFPFSLISDY